MKLWEKRKRIKDKFTKALVFVSLVFLLYSITVVQYSIFAGITVFTAYAIILFIPVLIFFVLTSIFEVEGWRNILLFFLICLVWNAAFYFYSIYEGEQKIQNLAQEASQYSDNPQDIATNLVEWQYNNSVFTYSKDSVASLPFVFSVYHGRTPTGNEMYCLYSKNPKFRLGVSETFPFSALGITGLCGSCGPTSILCKTLLDSADITNRRVSNFAEDHASNEIFNGSQWLVADSSRGIVDNNFSYYEIAWKKNISKVYAEGPGGKKIDRTEKYTNTSTLIINVRRDATDVKSAEVIVYSNALKEHVYENTRKNYPYPRESFRGYTDENGVFCESFGGGHYTVIVEEPLRINFIYFEFPIRLVGWRNKEEVYLEEDGDENMVITTTSFKRNSLVDMDILERGKILLAFLFVLLILNYQRQHLNSAKREYLIKSITKGNPQNILFAFSLICLKFLIEILVLLYVFKFYFYLLIMTEHYQKLVLVLGLITIFAVYTALYLFFLFIKTLIAKEVKELGKLVREKRKKGHV